VHDTIAEAGGGWSSVLNALARVAAAKSR